MSNMDDILNMSIRSFDFVSIFSSQEKFLKSLEQAERGAEKNRDEKIRQLEEYRDKYVRRLHERHASYEEILEIHGEDEAEIRNEKLICVLQKIMLRYSGLVSLVTAIEWAAVDFEKKFRKHRDVFEKYRRKGGTYCKIYCAFEEIAKSLGVEIPDEIREFNYLLDVRNCIVHNAGLVNYEEGRRKAKIICATRCMRFSVHNLLGNDRVIVRKKSILKHFYAWKKFIKELHRQV